MASASSDEATAPPPAKMPMGEGWTYRVDRSKQRAHDSTHFNTYYRDHQKLVPADKWDAFIEQVRSPLPMTLWINDLDPLASSIRKHFASLGRDVMAPIAWYPHSGMAWRLNFDKKTFRKAPEVASLRRYLIQQTAMGTTSRQEEVSMIPTLLLRVGANDRCLDMCASPGSKTAQLLVELGRAKLAAAAKARGLCDGGGAAAERCAMDVDYFSGGGCVVANELDEKRANMLVFQVRRLRPLFPFALFTNHDARYFPDLPTADTAEYAARKAGHGSFDKILCDVVCSGDGTLRKAPHLMTRWHMKEGINLQQTQIQIALRGVHLLKVGGRMVYSTCSLNPIENEAVVAQLVGKSGGAVRLVDGRSLLPGLQCDPGMLSWTVVAVNGKVANAPGEHNMHFNCFPPPVEEAKAMGLDKCMRLLPHHCNGGGFFVAVLEKVAPWAIVPKESRPPAPAPAPTPLAPPAPPAVTAASPTDDASTAAAATPASPASAGADEPAGPAGAGKKGAAAGGKRGRGDKPPLPPPMFVTTPDAAKSYLAERFGLGDFQWGNIFVRLPVGETDFRLTGTSNGCLVANDVRDILLANDVALKACAVVAAAVAAGASPAEAAEASLGTSVTPKPLIVVSVGLRSVATEHLTGQWRLAHESAATFIKAIGPGHRHVVDVTVADFLPLLDTAMRDQDLKAVHDEGLRGRLAALEPGPLLVRVLCPAAPGGFVPCAALRARHRWQLLVDKDDLGELACRLGLADHPLVTKVMSAAAGGADDDA